MAHYEHLPIYKSALDLCIYFEKIVRNFDRHHKYVIGGDLRRLSIKTVILIIKANDGDELLLSEQQIKHFEDGKQPEITLKIDTE